MKNQKELNGWVYKQHKHYYNNSNAVIIKENALELIKQAGLLISNIKSKNADMS